MKTRLALLSEGVNGIKSTLEEETGKFGFT